jgi:ribosomal protein S6E (S10)
MFTNTELQQHLENSATIRLQSAVIAEWNMNIAENISRAGNYRYRLNDTADTKYNVIAQSYDDQDSGNFYTGATDADVLIDGGFDDQGIPLAFVSKKEKERMLYSLEDCFGRFRPRSGINKLRYFENKYSHHDTLNLARRPRYYMADKKDSFKYWSSYRTEDGIERGISNLSINGQNYIEDAAPFVVYETPVPANRIVVKMQTNVGDIDLGPFTNSSGTFDDPLYGDLNKTTPIRWRIQYLRDNSWVDAASFNEGSLRTDGTPVVGPDGYVELAYGMIVPEDYRETFKLEKQLTSLTLLPNPSGMLDGTAYLVTELETQAGTVHIVNNNEFETFEAKYGWDLFENISRATSFVTDLTSPSLFTSSTNMFPAYREFENVGGLRVVVDTMNKFDTTFDLIELSPRLVVDLSDKVTSFSVNKSASDLGVSGLPVGQLLAATGSLEIFDFDQAFFKENKDSIISAYTSQNIQIKLYEILCSNKDYVF